MITASEYVCTGMKYRHYYLQSHKTSGQQILQKTRFIEKVPKYKSFGKAIDVKFIVV